MTAPWDSSTEAAIRGYDGFHDRCTEGVFLQGHEGRCGRASRRGYHVLQLRRMGSCFLDQPSAAQHGLEGQTAGHGACHSQVNTGIYEGLYKKEYVSGPTGA